MTKDRSVLLNFSKTRLFNCACVEESQQQSGRRTEKDGSWEWETIHTRYISQLQRFMSRLYMHDTNKVILARSETESRKYFDKILICFYTSWQVFSSTADCTVHNDEECEFELIYGSGKLAARADIKSMRDAKRWMAVLLDHYGGQSRLTIATDQQSWMPGDVTLSICWTTLKLIRAVLLEIGSRRNRVSSSRSNADSASMLFFFLCNPSV